MIKSKSTRALILIMSALVVIAILFAKSYYGNRNNAIDPRIKEARILYEKYNQYAQMADYDSVFWLLDTIESIYGKYEHYKNSFEVGVLYNNRTAIYITQALNLEINQKDSVLEDSLISIAEKSAKKSITLYEKWLEEYKDFESVHNELSIEKEFFVGLESLDEKLKARIVKQRVKEIEEALIETERRLSVSYTNLGVIYRQKEQYEQAAKHYKKAIDLWDKNLTAENNLNLLLSRPMKKRNLIQKLFPSERITN